MNLFSFIGQIFEPAVKLIDDVHTSTEEKLQLKNTLVTIQNEMHSKVLEYETKMLESKTAIITAEASGQSWLQRSWRPVTMLTFLALVVCDSFGWLANPLASEAWTLLQIGLGGYVTGRSLEKVASQINTKRG